MTEQIVKKIQVDERTTISSVWAVPPAFDWQDGSALVLGHGAGAGMNHPFMRFFHEGAASGGVMSVKFNFPYMESRRRVPDRSSLLERTFARVVDSVKNGLPAPSQIFIGGKSMGGRIATHLAAGGFDSAGLVLLGYPLHPPGKPGQLRVAHFPGIRCPTLFLQGTRDPFCELNLLHDAIHDIQGPVELRVIEGADHSLNVLKSSGRSSREVHQEILGVILRWIEGARTKVSRDA